MAGASSRDRAEIASGKASARDKREAGVRVSSHTRRKRRGGRKIRVKAHRRRKPRRR